MNGKKDPMNPWLAGVMTEYLQSHNLSELRPGYELFSRHNPDKDWDFYLHSRVLWDKVMKEPALVTPISALDLDGGVKTKLDEIAITVADLVQYTAEELNVALDLKDESALSPIEDSLGEYGLRLYHSDVPTDKVFVIQIMNKAEEDDLLVSSACKRAEEIMTDESLQLETRLRRAMSVYVTADKRADEPDSKCLVKTVLPVWHACIELADAYADEYPSLVHPAMGVYHHFWSYIRRVHGTCSEEFADACRSMAEMWKRLGHDDLSGRYYEYAASATAGYAGDDDIRVSLDYYEAGMAYATSGVSPITTVLNVFLKAAGVVERRAKEGEERQYLADLYSIIAECYKEMEDPGNEEKYRTLEKGLKTHPGTERLFPL